ncbi:hypothetical protein Scep_023999 [Stephania cephalantha]|uniref:Uncharacterized protein n=1 Tax=Stephania cephalantha TaxID=152367 RepID=A0AAP0F4N7_9MAGN
MVKLEPIEDLIMKNAMTKNEKKKMRSHGSMDPWRSSPSIDSSFVVASNL